MIAKKNTNIEGTPTCSKCGADMTDYIGVHDERMDEGAAIIVSLLVMIAVGILGLVWLGLKGLGVL